MKIAIRYFLYSVAFFTSLFIIIRIPNLLKEHATTTYNMFPYLIYTPLLYIAIGILLGLPTFLKENSKVGRWSFQIEKLVFVGIPALYIAFYPLLYFSTGILMLPSYINSLIMSTDIYLIAAVIFRHILITVVEKNTS
ncbi:hypothetical protein QUF88_11690 [Bacillus sp. DX1.1]|uniref:hypothetical protein n=1 Tax=unclassified Bacillus (in: firmicutes) TaxID=185979 RepID=UPI002570DFAB|nr:MULTISPECIES: hypothetical protein [unclassified Bacillus (in: firmicutes)]MDM5154473.1 hypothetical protein [Bacillus sp. DX1.1]